MLLFLSVQRRIVQLSCRKDLLFTLVQSVAVLKPLLAMVNVSLALLCGHRLQSSIMHSEANSDRSSQIFQGRLSCSVSRSRPSPSRQRIVAEVERRLSVVEELEAVVNANLQRATRLRQSILQRAFEGKLAPRYD